LGRIFLPLFILLLLGRAVCAEPWGPWSVSSDAPAMLTAADREAVRPSAAEPEFTGIAATPFLWIIRFHQKFISPIDGDRCSLYPTCSQYGILAIRKHGAIIGSVMTFDRLMHEGDEGGVSPAITVGNRLRINDPVENNDFWWMQRW